MKLMEIKELSPDEILTELKKAKQELVNLRMKFTARQLEDPSQIRKKRKEIARFHTVRTLKLRGENVKETKSNTVKPEKKLKTEIKKTKAKKKKREVN